MTTSRAARAQLGRSAEMFAALGDATRLELVRRLSSGGTQSITRLTQGLVLSRQAVTKHLRVLADVGLTRSAASGRETLWSVDTAGLDVARRYLEFVSASWDARLNSLRRHLAEDER